MSETRLSSPTHKLLGVVAVLLDVDLVSGLLAHRRQRGCPLHEGHPSLREIAAPAAVDGVPPSVVPPSIERIHVIDMGMTLEWEGVIGPRRVARPQLLAAVRA